MVAIPLNPFPCRYGPAASKNKHPLASASERVNKHERQADWRFGVILNGGRIGVKMVVVGALQLFLFVKG